MPKYYITCGDLSTAINAKTALDACRLAILNYDKNNCDKCLSKLFFVDERGFRNGSEAQYVLTHKMVTGNISGNDNENYDDDEDDYNDNDCDISPEEIDKIYEDYHDWLDDYNDD